MGAQAGAASTAGPRELLKSHWGRDLPAVSSTKGTPGGFLISSNGRTCGGGVAQGASSCLQPGLGPVLPPTTTTTTTTSNSEEGMWRWADLKVPVFASSYREETLSSDSSGQDWCISTKGLG